MLPSSKTSPKKSSKGFKNNKSALIDENTQINTQHTIQSPSSQPIDAFVKRSPNSYKMTSAQKTLGSGSIWKPQYEHRYAQVITPSVRFNSHHYQQAAGVNPANQASYYQDLTAANEA